MTGKKQILDLAEFGQWEQVERALHGDLGPLIELLRSDEAITMLVRNYIADEIEKEPSKRFRRQKRHDLSVREEDRMLLYRVYNAKMDLVLLKLGHDADDDAIFEAFDSISDRKALDHMSERWGLCIDQDSLQNALKRSPAGIFDPRGPRRRLNKMKKR